MNIASLLIPFCAWVATQAAVYSARKNGSCSLTLKVCNVVTLVVFLLSVIYALGYLVGHLQALSEM